MKFEWELLIGGTIRAKVIGGWIVHTFDAEYENIATCMVFIPDPNHEWVIDE